MNIDRITKTYGKRSEETRYLIAVAERLERIFGQLTCERETIALISFLNLKSIHFVDGFIASDLRELAHTIGYEQASTIASSLSVDPDKPPIWWKTHRAAYDSDDSDLDRVKQKILASPDVLMLE